MSPIRPIVAFGVHSLPPSLTTGPLLRCSLHLFPRRLPRSQLRSTPILRRAALNRPHQRRGFSTDSVNRESVPSRVVALPLSHRPLLPGMTIQLQIHKSLYNKIATDLHLNQSSMVGAFLAHDFHSGSSSASGGSSANNQYRNRLGPNDPKFVMVNGNRRRLPVRLPMPARIDRSLMASQFVDLPSINDIHRIGTLCRIVEISAEDGLLIESIRAIAARSVANRELLTVDIEAQDDVILQEKDSNLVMKLKNELILLAQQMASRRHLYANHLRVVVERARAAPDRTDLSMLVNQVAGLCTNMTPDQEQRLVEELDPIRRAVIFLNLISSQSVAAK